MEAVLDQFWALPDNYKGLVLAVVLTFVWTIMYKLLHPIQQLTCAPYRALTQKQKVEWNTRVVSTVHALFAVGVAVRTMYSDPAFHTPRDGLFVFSSSFGSVLGAAATLSYWIYDLIVTIANWEAIGDKLMMIHHSVGIVPFTIGMYRTELVQYAIMIIMTEVSTPFVNNRWFMAVTKKSSGNLYVYNGLMMWATFLCARILWIPYMFYHMWNVRDQIMMTMPVIWVPTLFGITVTLGLSTYWFVLITKGMLKAVGLLPGSKPAAATTTTKPKKA